MIRGSVKKLIIIGTPLAARCRATAAQQPSCWTPKTKPAMAMFPAAGLVSRPLLEWDIWRKYGEHMGKIW